MSAASQSWNVLEIRLMILKFFFATCTFRMHNPRTCKSRNLKPTKSRKPKSNTARANESHIAIFLAQRGVMLHAHPIFLAWSTFEFQPAWCVIKSRMKHGDGPSVYGCLSQLRLIPLTFLKAIKNFEVSIDHVNNLITGLRRIRRVGAVPVVKLIEDNQELSRGNRMDKLKDLRRSCLNFVILEVKILRKNRPQVLPTILRLNTDGTITTLNTNPKNSDTARPEVTAFASELNRKYIPRRVVFKLLPSITMK